MTWLLLLHQIPPKPAYLRAKILRRLNQLGALSIKNSAYLLPSADETVEDLQWVRREVIESGGDAWVFEAGAVAGLTDRDIRKAFRELRRMDYEELLAAGRKLLGDLREADWRKLKRRYDEVRRIDFFAAPGQEEMEDLMRTIDCLLHGSEKAPAIKPDRPGLTGRCWVTRRGVKVDRISSAWLVRRFVDPQAEFRFVDPETYTHTDGELRFDMFEGEFTHEGEKCTFEVLLDWTGLGDPALRGLAEVIHDIDLKDAKFGRPETAGVAAMIDGLVLRHADDARRLEEGAGLLDALYARLSQ